MSNADNELIPFINEDQGEGIRDFYSNMLEFKRETSQSLFNRLRERTLRHDDPVNDEMEDLKMGVAEFAFKKGGR